MFWIIVAAIAGALFGYVLNGVLSSNTTEERLQEAYEKGKADEKERIWAEVQNKYGVDEPKEV